MNYRLLLPIAALLLSGAVYADDDSGFNGFYVAGSVGPSNQRFDPSTFNVHGSDTGYQIGAGFRPIDLLAGEIDYVGFGRASQGTNYADTYGVGISALGFLPIPVVDVYGRVGLMDFRTDAQSPYLSFHRTGADLTYGAGAGMHWGTVGARIEYSRFNVPRASGSQLASVGVVWNFL